MAHHPHHHLHPPQPHHLAVGHHHAHAAAVAHHHPHHAHHGHGHGHQVGGHGHGHSHHMQSSVEFLNSLALQSPLDVYDIHETGWRRAILLAKRDRHEFLVRYVGWDSKWDEWIKGTSGRLAPANSKTASLAYTGYKGPKSADEVASIELGRDWNNARQEGVMCDVLFVLHSTGRPGTKGRTTPLSASPLKARTSSNSRRTGVDENEMKHPPLPQSSPSTPATSPMVRGLSGLGIISPQMGPIHSPTPPTYFSAHSHMINMRCPELLKSAVISLPPVTTFDDSANDTPDHRPLPPSFSPDEQKDDVGGRSLADRERANGITVPASSIPSAVVAPIPTTAIATMLQYELGDVDLPSTSPPVFSLTSSTSEENKAPASLDEDDNQPRVNEFTRSASMSNGMFAELHPTVTTYDIWCVPNPSIMHNLLTFIYTGDLSTHVLPSIQQVFEMATLAHLLHLTRLLDLCALALNRMLNQENFLTTLKMGLRFQSKVLANLDTICSSLHDTYTSSSQSIANEIQSSMSHISNAKIHPHLSPLLRVCFEYIMTHWETCWHSYENLIAFQQLPQPMFQIIMRMMPLKNTSHSTFSVIYPTIHPQPCNLTTHFKRLYENRHQDNTDFRIIVGEGEEEHTIHVHKAVLACRSEYFRALFRCSLAEYKDNCVRLDASQHNPASIEALVKYLYAADLKVDPNCGVYLSNCTDFFGLSSNSLEHACQELVSQHHCLKVLKAAWKSDNDQLFTRACKFIDWSTLATLMNGQGLEDEPIHCSSSTDESDSRMDESESPDDENDVDDGNDVDHVVEGGGVSMLFGRLASSTTSPSSSSPSTPRSRLHSSSNCLGSLSPPTAIVDASDVEMWKAIVFCKANPTMTSANFHNSNHHSNHSTPNSKRARTNNQD